MAKRPLIWTGHEDAAWLAEKLAVVVKGICKLDRALNEYDLTSDERRGYFCDIKDSIGVVIGALFANIDEAQEINEIFRADDGDGVWVMDLIHRLGRNSIYYKLTYKDLLKLPEWQRKRLEIMKERRFRCESCEDSESMLHVHHKKYGHGLPWDMPSTAFEILCEKCHKKEHAP